MKFALIPLVLLAGCATAPPPVAEKAAETPAFKPAVSINQVMVSVIDHNSHTLWDVAMKKNAPKKDADWHVLEHAAVTLAAAGNMVMMGGTGVTDNVWAKDPKWTALAQDMTTGGQQAFDAVQKKDVTALLAAGDNIVVACEACHKQFKPTLPKIRATPEEQVGH
jgi:cytochrome c556